MNLKWYIFVSLLFFIVSFDYKVSAAQLPHEQTGSDSDQEVIAKWVTAAKAGDLETMQNLVSKVDVNGYFEGKTALIVAIERSYSTPWVDNVNRAERIIKYLLTVPGIDANICLKDTTFSPLIHAVYDGYGDNIINLLLQFPGIAVNESQKLSGDTALMYGAKYGKLSAIKCLLQAPGIDVNRQNINGETALIKSVFYGFEDIVESLLEAHGINIITQTNVTGSKDIRFTGEFGKTALEIAQSKFNERQSERSAAIVTLIKNRIEELTIKAFESVSAKVTSDAERQNYLETLKLIIRQIGDNIVDNNGNTLLDKAFAFHNSKIIEYLLQNSKDPRELLSRFPFESISPSSALFVYFFDLAFGLDPKQIKTDAPKKESAPEKLCAFCAKRASNICSKCKKIYYCSRECQKAHWNTHKHVCRTA